MNSILIGRTFPHKRGKSGAATVFQSVKNIGNGTFCGIYILSLSRFILYVGGGQGDHYQPTAGIPLEISLNR